MPTLVLDPQPSAIEQLLQERARLGLERRDEVWEGVLHMIPPPSVEHGRLLSKLDRLLGPLADAAGLELAAGVSVGESTNDYRVPDLTLLRPGSQPQSNPTAAVAIEILSPGGKTWDKLPFYATHDVDEVLIVDPTERTVRWLARAGDRYEPVARSELLDLGPGELAGRLDWPDAAQGQRPQDPLDGPGASRAPLRPA